MNEGIHLIKCFFFEEKTPESPLGLLFLSVPIATHVLPASIHVEDYLTIAEAAVVREVIERGFDICAHVAQYLGCQASIISAFASEGETIFCADLHVASFWSA